jgi:Sec-independent protein secretion pathway component TatC
VVGTVKLLFTRHIHDLLRRLEWPVIVLIAGAFLAYLFRGGLIDWLHAPLLANLEYGPVSAPTEFQSAACLLVGVWLSIPVGMLQLSKAMAPVTRRQALQLVGASVGCLVVGVALAYAALPGIIGLLSGIHIADFRPFILAETYLLFVINFLGIAAIISQLPLLLLVIDRVRPLSMPTLLLWQKWVALGAVVACFILPTAPEPLSQLILALVVVAAYELSLGVVWLSRNHRRLLAKVRKAPQRTKPQPPAAAPRPDMRRGAPARPVARPVARPIPAPHPAALRPAPRPVAAPRPTPRPLAQPQTRRSEPEMRRGVPAPAAAKPTPARPARPMDRPSGPAVIDMRPKEH